MRALVLGGAGFIGVQACRELMRRGVETVAAGRSQRPYGTFTSYVQVDRSDREQLAATLASVMPDVLLDLACYRPADMAAVIEAFRGRRYVFASSAAVYPDRTPAVMASEEDFTPLLGDPPGGEIGYADGKRWCETLLSRAAGFPATVLRPPNVLGPGDHTLRIAGYLQRVEDGGWLLAPAETRGQPLGVVGVRDVGYACALACDPKRQVDGRSYNLPQQGVTPEVLVDACARAMGLGPRLCHVPWDRIPPSARLYGPPPGRPAGYADRRARTDLGWEPATLEEALAETLAWYRASRPSDPGYSSRPDELAVAAEYCGESA